MDQVRFVESAYRIEHRHGDGSWSPMEEVPRHHDAADHDPERRWGLARIFRCTKCTETLTITEGEEGAGDRSRR